MSTRDLVPHLGKNSTTGFAGTFFSDTKKKYAINELEVLAVDLVLEHFRLRNYGRPINLPKDHQNRTVLEPIQQNIQRS